MGLRLTGGYFVTICLQNRGMHLGEVIDRAMRLNAAGRMITATWFDNATRFPDATLDTFIVMPDHLHAIVFIGTDPTVRDRRANLIRLVQAFKSISTREYGAGVRAGLYPPYDRTLWQRSFHDHIIRDDRDLDRVRAYIDGNPSRWAEKHGDPTHRS